MSALSERLRQTRMQYALGAAMLALLVFFLVKSSQTGRAEYEAAEDTLARIEALDLELNALLFPLLFETQTDLDEFTRVANELYEAAARYDIEHASQRPTALFERVREKLQFVDDFKAQQAVMRNSRAIGMEMLTALSARPETAEPSVAEALFEAESSFLEFLSRRDPPTMAALRETIAEIEGAHAELAQYPEWRTFASQAETTMDYSARMAMLMFELFGVPLPQQIAAELEAVDAWFASRSRTASNYRFGMFAVALLLLGFSGYKALQARGYYRMIERSNDELERRVAERTSELSKANDALESEIRERVSIESQLRIAQKLESIGQLAAGIAHEINTPTQYVSDNVTFLSTAWRDIEPLLDDYESALENGDLDTHRGRAIWKRADVDYLREEVPAALGAATDGLAQIGRIVRAIKDFSHPGDDAPQPEDINRAIENSVTVARNEWKYVAAVSLDLDPALPRVPCNVSAFNQVILNLVVNSAQAIEANPPPSGLGNIRVATRFANDFAEIVVEDDGPGIPESIRDQVFDPFFTTKEVGKGTGQGLAIAFRVVTKQHGGTLTVGPASQGGGARFTIRLPLDPTESDAPVGQEPELDDTIRTLALHVEH